ncbi:hypothetical protein FOA24_24030 [Bacillus thuringiensis]|uniref:hypothetical protein n=1 Tax=Bacillus thuringiensis TaxID=1428 RepID=UPI003339F545
MNQNDNYNGYGVMDGGAMYHQPRYPYAKAPGAEYQQMNYKDWMNRCAYGESEDSLRDISDAIKYGLIVTTGIGWALLGLIPIYGPVLSAAAGVLNVLIPALWPDQPGIPPGSIGT